MRYLKFCGIGRKGSSNKEVWEVRNKKNELLGQIEWDRKYYVFVPHLVVDYKKDTYRFEVFSHECLDEISAFIKKIEKEQN